MVTNFISRKSKAVQSIHQLSIDSLTSRYYMKKINPPLVSAYTNNVDPFKNEIAISERLPIYSYPYDLNYFNTAIVTNIKFPNVPDNLVNFHFTNHIKEAWPNSYHIYTDGSKLERNVGCAVWDKEINLSLKYKLSSFYSVYSSELIAIIKALDYITNIDSATFVIFTDCLSGLSKLQNFKFEGNNNYLLYEILKKINFLRTQKKDAILCWVKGHIGIKGNEIVDGLAREATLDGNIYDLFVPKSDFGQFIKINTIQNWESEYVQNSKGARYKSIQPKIVSRPWFERGQKSKHFIATINRLRANHGMFKAHLFKINFDNSNLCTCNEVMDLDHIFLICSNLSQDREILLQRLLELEVAMPFSLLTLLESKNLLIYEALYDYLKNVQIDI